MRVRFTRRGLRVERPGAVVVHSYGYLVPLVLLPLAILVSIGRGIERSTTHSRGRLSKLIAQRPDEAAQRFWEFNRSAAINAVSLREPAPDSRLPTIDIYVSAGSAEGMQEAKKVGDRDLGHEPGGDRPYFRGVLRDESGRLQRMKIAYRGTMGSHHWPEKPSYRVRIRRSEIALGRRYVELTSPKDVLALRHLVPQFLGDTLGVPHAQAEPVRVFLNGNYRGVYLRSYRPGEALALASGRYGATFFKGDAIGRMYGRSLWKSPQAWRQFGEGGPTANEALQRFLQAFRKGRSLEGVRALLEALDAEAYARWAAVNAVAGCVHTDAFHNQLYVHSSYRGKLEAGSWDPTCFETAAGPFVPVNWLKDPVMDLMTHNPLWVHRRNQLIQGLLLGSGSAAAIRTRIEKHLERLRPDLESDAHLGAIQMWPGYRHPFSVKDIDPAAQAFIAWAEAKVPWLQRFLDDARCAVEENPKAPGEARVSVFGSVAIEVVDPAGQPLVVRDSTGQVVERLYPGLALRPAVMDYPVAKGAKVPYLPPAALVYQVEAPPAALRFRNAITGAAVTPSSSPPASSPRERTFPPSAFVAPVSSSRTLGPGVVRLERDLVVGSGATLTLRPGTTLRLAAGVGIYVSGRFLAEGSAAAPIRLEPLDPKAGWGALALTGPGTAGSKLAHVKVWGGGEIRRAGLWLKGMVSVYGCPDLTLRNCVFGANLRGDDAVNLAESQISVTSCRFEDSLADALDLDACRGVVSDCVFSKPGNDGLDLMACQLIVTGCRFLGCGDKGVSVGEGTKLLLSKSSATGCAIGVEVKDASWALLRQVELAGKVCALRAYRKKWLFPSGGRALLVDCTLGGVRDLDVLPQSWVSRIRTRAREPLPKAGRGLELKEVPAEWLALERSLRRRP